MDNMSELNLLDQLTAPVPSLVVFAPVYRKLGPTTGLILSLLCSIADKEDYDPIYCRIPLDSDIFEEWYSDDYFDRGEISDSINKLVELGIFVAPIREDDELYTKFHPDYKSNILKLIRL
jgi:hypothetical protein